MAANRRKMGTPAPARAHGPLLPSGPGGVDEMDAAGVRRQSNRVRVALRNIRTQGFVCSLWWAEKETSSGAERLLGKSSSTMRRRPHPRSAQNALTCAHNRFRRQREVAPERPPSSFRGSGRQRGNLIMMNIKDTLSTHRSERAAHRQLAHELADYTSAADRLEIETIAARYSEED